MRGVILISSWRRAHVSINGREISLLTRRERARARGVLPGGTADAVPGEPWRSVSGTSSEPNRRRGSGFGVVTCLHVDSRVILAACLCCCLVASMALGVGDVGQYCQSVLAEV